MLPENCSLRFTKGMDATPLRPPRSPILSDRASERGWLRTPHLFARVFFVHLSRIFAGIFERKNGGRSVGRAVKPCGGCRP
jgi:hypothetical protein